MDDLTRRLISFGAILAPALHTFTDVVEWLAGGFTTEQLWLNYFAFLPVPIILIGLYAAQRPLISYLGLAGAILYGFAFVYFAHSTQFALTENIADYEALWDRLGTVYTANGAMMVVGGIAFGVASFRACVFPKWTSTLFLAGVFLNLLLSFLPVPEIMQTLGTALRNAGLIGMGWSLLLSDAMSGIDE
ncbi:MAG: hypothetical protein J5I65_13265 [Aridibacter famidurans]|nr:hypothetical protein [Aridibacter famidurans]